MPPSIPICLNPLKRVNSILMKEKMGMNTEEDKVSIPSNGSIQFLQDLLKIKLWTLKCLNPLKRVNSILTDESISRWIDSQLAVSIPSNGSIQFLPWYTENGIIVKDDGLNPLKRVNSILTSSNISWKFRI